MQAAWQLLVPRVQRKWRCEHDVPVGVPRVAVVWVTDVYRVCICVLCCMCH